MICTSPASAPRLVEERTALLQRHLPTISGATVRTREEMAEPRPEQDAGRGRDESQAVVQNAERATDTILGAFGTVDDRADEATRGHAAAIRARIQDVFAACNFPDRPGRRRGEDALPDRPARPDVAAVPQGVTAALVA